MEIEDSSAQPSPADLGDVPRDRYAALRKSCDLCKRMKIRCERRGNSCAHCDARHVNCETTLVSKRKQVRKARKHVAHDVEDRIQRLESLLTASQANPTGDSSTNASETSVDLTDQLSTLVIDEKGTFHFMGSSSGLSLFSPQGLRWISEKTGNDDLSNFIKEFSTAGKGFTRPEPSDLWFSSQTSEREPLPPKYIADLYVHSFFDTFNSCMPLFDRATFDHFYELQYAGKPPPGSAWYACLNVVICMGCSTLQSQYQRREKGSPSTHLEAHQAHWKYYRNAFSCFLDILFKDCSLMGVQALCGMAFIQQTTFNPDPFYFLVSSAGRLAYRLGLHRRLDDFGISPSEMETRRNVLWIVYCLDKSLSLRVGHPSIFVDDDIGVDLPPETSPLLTCSDGSRRFNVFRYLVQLAQLESRTFSGLYSIRSRNRSATERLKSVAALDNALQEWREAVPLEVRPGKDVKCSEEQLRPVLMMHFTYLNCHTTIHRIAIHHNSWKNDRQNSIGSTINNKNLDNRVRASEVASLTDARDCIKLLRYFDGDGLDDMILMIFYYPLSSFITLFANILHDPKHSNATSDLGLMEIVIAFLDPAVTENSPFTVFILMRLLRGFAKVATKLVEQTKSRTETPGNSFTTNVDFVDLGQAPNSNHLTGQMSQMNPPLLDSYPESEIPNQANSFMTFSNSQVQLQPQVPSSSESQDPGFHEQPQMHDPSGMDIPPLPNDLNTYPTLSGEGPIFSEYFEWDLANLWRQSSFQDY